MLKALLLVAAAATVAVVRGDSETPCAFSWNGYGATSDPFFLSTQFVVCQLFIPNPQYPVNIPSPEDVAGIVANMAGCALNNYAYILGYEGLGPATGQCMAINFATGAVEIQSGAFCSEVRPIICYVDTTYTEVLNLSTSTVSVESVTTPIDTIVVFTLTTSTSFTDITDSITTDFVITSTTSEFSTTIPSTTTTISTEIVSESTFTVITLTSSRISTSILGSTTLTQEFIYFVTTTTQIAVPGSTTITTTLGTTTVCRQATTTVSRCLVCPTGIMTACPCHVDAEEAFIVISNPVPFNQANCACKRVYAELAAPNRSEFRAAANVMRECTDCEHAKGAWIEPISDNLCSILTPSGSIKFVSCDSAQQVLCRVPQILAHNNCFECQFHANAYCALSCPRAPKRNPWNSQCYDPESSSSSSSSCEGKKKTGDKLPAKVLGSRPVKGRHAAKALTYNICPFVSSNIFLITGVDTDDSADIVIDSAEACFQSGGSFLELLVSQLSIVQSLLTVCSKTDAWIASYNTGSAAPCGYVDTNGIVHMFSSASSCATPRAILCYFGNNPAQTTAPSVIPEIFTSETTLTIITNFITLSFAVETTSTTTDFDYLDTINTTLTVTTDFLQGTSSITETTTSISTATQTSSTTFRGFTSFITVQNTSVTLSSALSTATLTNYLGTSTTSTIVSICGCKSGMPC